MPTERRTSRRLDGWTFTPAALTLPPSMVSRPLMQRSSVLLPEPERPMMATTSPSATSRSTPSSTVAGPKRLVSALISTIGIESLLQAARQQIERKAHREVQGADHAVHQDRLERDVVDVLRRMRELVESD